MKIERGKQPYRIADVETTTAVLEALRWERDNNTPLFADVQTRLHAARLARAAYQRHLLKRFVALITSRLRTTSIHGYTLAGY